MIRRSLLALCNLLAFVAFQCAPAAAVAQNTQPTTRMALGVNVDENTGDTTTGAWADIGHGFTGWYDCQQWTVDGFPLTNNAHCRSSMLSCPPGKYTLTYEGTGSITASWAGAVSNVKKSGVTTTADLIVNAANSAVMFTATGQNPADPLRNMHVWAPGYGPGTANAGKTFRDEYLKWLAPFKVVRMIDWAGVNVDKASELAKPTTQPTTWASRVTPTQWDQTSRGVAYEYQLALAKQAGVDWWVNIPYLADDDFIRQLAGVIAQAPPTMTVYVEAPGNEVWNSGFGQWLQNYTRANMPPNMSVDGDVSTGRLIPYPNGQPGTDSNTRAARLYADRARQVSYILRQQLGGHRIKFVLAGQAMWTMWLDEGTKYIQAKYGDVDRAFDCLAIAPYWPLDASGSTVPQMADGCRSFLIGQQLATALQGHLAIANHFGLQLVAYEAGQNVFASSNPPFAASDVAVNLQNDPLMGGLYTTSLNVFQQQGVTLMMHNSFIRPWTKSGLFALQQGITDPPGQKWMALNAWATAPTAPAVQPSTQPSTQPATLPAAGSGTLNIGGKVFDLTATLRN